MVPAELLQAEAEALTERILALDDTGARQCKAFFQAAQESPSEHNFRCATEALTVARVPSAGQVNGLFDRPSRSAGDANECECRGAAGPAAAVGLSSPHHVADRVGMFFDGFDIYVASTVLGATLKSGFSTLGQNALFVSLTFLGMMLGSLATGFLGDSYGRRFTYHTNLMVFGMASLGAALAPDMAVLIACRFMIGLGLGAENVVGYSTLTEFAPPASRGKLLGLMAVFVGIRTAGRRADRAPADSRAWLARDVCARRGWRNLRMVCTQVVPESSRWLESVGHNKDAEAILSGSKAR